MNAVLALGFIGAGTNNARLAGMLRQLSSYYYKCVCSPNEGHLSVLGFWFVGWLRRYLAGMLLQLSSYCYK